MQYNHKLQKDLTANTLKNIAIIAMFLDHLFAVFVPNESVLGILLRIPGRIVAPIMCYFIAEGFFYTSNVKKYMTRLFIFAAISHFPYVMYFGLQWWKATSVIWGLALGLVALAATKNDKLSIYIKILVVAVCCILAVPADWNYVSVLWIVAFGIFRGQFKKQMISFIIIGLIFHMIPVIINLGWPHSYEFGIILAVPLLALYKGKRGKQSKNIKWGFYIFYPVHLILLYVLRCIEFA